MASNGTTKTPLTGTATKARWSKLTTDSLWKNAEYADITIKFSGREIKCHKLVICNKSKYFKDLCGANATFKARHLNLHIARQGDTDV